MRENTYAKGADAALLVAWLSHLEHAKGRRKRTLETYWLAIERLCEFLAGSKPLVDVEPGELEAFGGVWLHKRGVVARSRKPYISAVRMFYAWLHRTGRTKGNLAAQLEHPKTGRPLPFALSLASAEKLMWAPDLNTFIGIRDAAMLALLMGCGLRVSGLTSLNESALRNDEIGGKVRLVLNVTEKGGKERRLPIPKEAEMLLRIYLDHEGLRAIDRDVLDAKGRADKVLFVNVHNSVVPRHEYRGEAVRLGRQSVWKMIQAYGEKAGVPEGERHPHAFRHLFGTELAEDEVDLIMRQQLLGHTDPKSTAIYDEMSMRRKTRVMDRSGPLGKMKTPVSEVLKRLPASPG